MGGIEGLKHLPAPAHRSMWLPSCLLTYPHIYTATLLHRALAAEPARDFVQACLRRNEGERPTAEQLLEHPWLQDELAVSDVPFDDTIVQRLQRYGLYGRCVCVAITVLPSGRCQLSRLRWPAWGHGGGGSSSGGMLCGHHHA